MLPPDEWESVLGGITGTIVHGSERISSNRLLDALSVGTIPAFPVRPGATPELGIAGAGNQTALGRRRLLIDFGTEIMECPSSVTPA